MRRSSRWSVLFIALSVILAVSAVPIATAENSNAILRPDPLSLGLKPGDQGSMVIRVDDVQNLYGLEFHMSFDPSIIEVVDADPAKSGVQIQQQNDLLKNSFVAVNKADNAAGTIDYAVTLLNPAPPVSGGGPVAIITFRAKGNGTSPLKVDKAIFATRKAEEIKSVWQDGAIGVSPLGQAPEVKPIAELPNTSSSPASQVPIFQIALLGAAGLGMLAFFGALVLVLAIVVIRRRS